MEAANNKRIKSVFFPHFLAMDSLVSSHELHLSIFHILASTADFREIADNSVNDEMTEREDIKLGSIGRVVDMALGRHVGWISWDTC